jgi:hypothetical protein
MLEMENEIPELSTKLHLEHETRHAAVVSAA